MVKFRFVPSNFFISAVISVIVISVRMALSLTLAILWNSSARSLFAISTLWRLVSFVINWAATNWAIWQSKSATWLWSALAVAGTEDNVEEWGKSALRWSIGSYWAGFQLLAIAFLLTPEGLWYQSPEDLVSSTGHRCSWICISVTWNSRYSNYQQVSGPVDVLCRCGEVKSWVFLTNWIK